MDLSVTAALEKSLHRHVKQLTVGDSLPPVIEFDQDGRPLNSEDDWCSGRFLAISLCADLTDQRIVEELRGFAGLSDLADNNNFRHIVVSANDCAATNREVKRATGLPAPIVSDPNGAIFAAFGLCKIKKNVSPTPMRTVLATPSRRVCAIWDIDQETTAMNQSDNVRETVQKSLARDVPQWPAPHPPVLIVPNALDPEECQRLVEHFNTKGPLRIEKPLAHEGPQEFKMPTYEYGRQDRIDHIINDASLAQMVDAKLAARVNPLVKQAFAFDVASREHLHIAYYKGTRAGQQLGHRDNRTATQHRKFALSISLNTDYEGGDIVFREFSNHGYRNEPGTALVFSSSLLHEVEEVTAGERFVLISHLY